MYRLSETSVHFYNVQSARESPRRGTKYFDERANTGARGGFVLNVDYSYIL
jgi:hypothetical protein